MRAIFQKKGKRGQKMLKKGKIFKKFGQKCTKFENILKQGSRKGPDRAIFAKIVST